MPPPRDFAALITPDDPAYLEMGRETWGERDDLREAFGDVEGLGFRKWLAVNGPLEYPDRFARFFPPIPDKDLRLKVCGGATAHQHMYSSVEDLQTLVHLLELFVDDPFGEMRSVLDFGCGCGRTLRWFPLAFPGIEIHGADVRVAAIDWCRQQLDGHYFANAIQPPLPLADDCVDLALSLSVFSHLERASNLAWIGELSRVCRDQGHLFVTTHGMFALNVLTKSAEHQKFFHMTEAQARDYIRRLQNDGFVQHCPDREWVEAHDGVEDGYGMTFFSPRFVEEAWSAHAEIVGHVPAALSFFQDVYVLKPRKT